MSVLPVRRTPLTPAQIRAKEQAAPTGTYLVEFGPEMLALLVEGRLHTCRVDMSVFATGEGTVEVVITSPPYSATGPIHPLTGRHWRETWILDDSA